MTSYFIINPYLIFADRIRDFCLNFRNKTVVCTEVLFCEDDYILNTFW